MRAALLAVVLLAGCVTDPPIVQTDVKTVYVPTPVPCVTEDKIPAVPPRVVVPADASPRQRADGVASELSAQRAYAAKADPLLRACAVQPEEKK